MKLTLESLYKDHDNLRRVLYLIEQLLIDIYRGSSKCYPMLQRILAYIQEYPERVHHPAEDAMFSVVLKSGVSDRQLREDINTLIRDHSEIEEITRDAIAAVESMLASTNLENTDVGTKLCALLTRQRSHLLFEEMKIYPHIEEYLGSEDWGKISTLIPDQEDPIFGEKVRKEYEYIFKAL